MGKRADDMTHENPTTTRWPFTRPRSTPTPLNPRQLAQCRRVTLLVGAIFLMGLADLLITVTYIRSVGMFEMNPIARFMLSIGSINQLIRYKLFTMVLSCGVLYLLRRHPKAEIGAWICVAMLFALTMHWVRYNASIMEYSNDLQVLAQTDDEVSHWVHIPYTE